MPVWSRALVAALAAAVPTFLALRVWLPRSLGHESFVPHGAALAAAVSIGLAVLARQDARARAPARGAALACGLAALLVALVVTVGGPETISGHGRTVAHGVCAGLGLAAWLGATWKEKRLGRRVPDFTAVLVGLALATFTIENAGSLHGAVTGRSEQGWNLYHYYLGSKYFPELGYGELYSAHLAADVDNGGRDFGFVTKARSMATYRETPRRELLARFDRRALFSEERWDELRRDVHALRPLLSAQKWQGAMIDLGYHPSPAWTVVGTPLANLVDVRGPGWWWLVNSDLPLHALCFAAMLWAFGLRTTALAVLWLTATPINSGFFAGGFLRHDWLHSVILMAALWHKGYPASAGVALSWGAMTRIFPGAIAIPIVVRALAALVRGGPGAVSPAQARFLVALGVAGALLFGASHLTGRGQGTWPEWIDIITTHGHLHPVTSNRRVGVGRLVLHDPGADDAFGTVAGSLEEKLERRLWHRRALQLAGLALLVAACWRRRDLDAMILTSFGVFLLATLSRYHGSLWVLLFFLGAGGGAPRDRPPWPALLAGAALLASVVVFFAPPGMSAQYYVLNYEMLAMFTALCVGWLVADRRRARPSTVVA